MGDKVDLLQLKARLERLGVHIDAPASPSASLKRDCQAGASLLQVGLQDYFPLIIKAAAAALQCSAAAELLLPSHLVPSLWQQGANRSWECHLDRFVACVCYYCDNRCSM